MRRGAHLQELEGDVDHKYEVDPAVRQEERVRPAVVRDLQKANLDGSDDCGEKQGEGGDEVPVADP